MINKIHLLTSLVYNGLIKKNIVPTDSFEGRIQYELSVIEKLGFIDYFILFSRIIEACNELNILRSYGRGSAANSLVNYCLDITKINPIDENLVFERFLNPKQILQPDIDIDIPKGYQNQVIEKLKQNFPEYKSYAIAFSPQKNTDYVEVIHKRTKYKKHPCGFIITSKKLTQNTFSYKGQAYYLAVDIANDKYFENKIDILELEYLNRLQLIINEIGQAYHPYSLPLDDKKVFDFIASGDLNDVFQFNATSLKRIFSQFKPNSIQDLSIINAMFRPGILDYIPTIIDNKFSAHINFCKSDPRVTEILKETYGLMIYQETFLHLAKEIAGISFEEADIWRRKIMRDKSKNEVILFTSVFAKGCKDNSSLNKDDILSLTNMVAEMVGITFQKSHALSYSIMGYWGAYYKTYFRTHFDKAFDNKLKFEPFELY